VRQAERSAEIAIGVGSLERRQTEARARLERLLETVDTDPKGPENRPHTIPTNQATYPERDTAVADEGRGSPAEPELSNPKPHDGREEKEGAQARPRNEGTTGSVADREPASEADQEDTQQQTTQPPGLNEGTAIRLSTDEMTRLAPRLRTYVKSPRPAWPEIVDAADWLRGELGVCKSLWDEACIAMGREQAAIAIAIVSAKPAEHFRSTPGRYFHGMVANAKAGKLNLARMVWSLRQAVAPKPCRT
jgi:replication initiation protein RepC